MKNRKVVGKIAVTVDFDPRKSEYAGKHLFEDLKHYLRMGLRYVGDNVLYEADTDELSKGEWAAVVTAWAPADMEEE